jgi:NAD(P)H-nitrite reductase large subunit
MEKRQDIQELSAVVQRDGERYAITPRIPGGLITDFSLLRRIAEVAERYGAQAIKITSAQRIALIGIAADDLESVWRDLGMKPGYATGLCVRSVKACPGTRYCRLGQQDALGLGIRLEEAFLGRAAPNKLKIAVSGCPLCCAESRVRDIGLIGGKRGYAVVVGGAAAGKARIAESFAEGVAPEDAERLVGGIIEAYFGFGKKKRLGDLLEEIGIEAFRQAVAARGQ